MKLHYCITLSQKDVRFVNLHFIASKWQIMKVFHALAFLLPTSNITSIDLSVCHKNESKTLLAHSDGSKFLTQLSEVLINIGG